MIKIHKRISLVMIGVVFAVATFISIALPARAVQILCDYNFLESNNVAFWDPCESTSCFAFDPSQLSAESNFDHRGKQILNQAQFTALDKNLEAYKSAANTAKIPWQLLAAVHQLETGLKQLGPINGFGPYQIKSQTHKVGAYSEEEFEDATNKAAEYFKQLAGTKDLSEIDNVKYVLFQHNGAQELYVTQGEKLGFTSTQAKNGEGSPYVMNNADSERDPTSESAEEDETWGELKNDQATALTYPAAPYHGAFVVYAAISGIKVSGGCNGGIVAGGMTLDEAKSFMRTYINSADSVNFVGGAWSHPTYGPLANCVSFSNYFVNKYTGFRTTLGHGANLASNFIGAYPEVPHGSEPQPYAMFSSPRPGKDGHTGIILGVDDVKGTLVIGDQGWGSPLRDPKEVTIERFNSTYGPLTYVYLADYLKEDI